MTEQIISNAKLHGATRYYEFPVSYSMQGTEYYTVITENSNYDVVDIYDITDSEQLFYYANKQNSLKYLTFKVTGNNPSFKVNSSSPTTVITVWY